MTRIDRRPLRAAVAIGLTALALSACGNSSHTTSSSTASDPGTTSQATHSNALFPAAVAANAKYMQRPTSIGITTPVGKPIPKGKVIDFIECGVPSCTTEAQVLRQATAALGWKLVSINAGDTPQSTVAAYQQAIQNKPSAVLGSGSPRVLFNPELKQLAAMHIPVVEGFVDDKPGNGLTGIVDGTESTQIMGREFLDYMLAHATSKSEEFGAIVADYPTQQSLVAELQSSLHQQCPQCTLKVLDVPITSIGNDLTSRVTAFLTANPQIKWLYAGDADMADGLPTALRGASLSPNVVVSGLDASTVPYLRNGEFLQAGNGVTLTEILWRQIDLLARYFTHRPYTVDLNDATLPYWTITQSNLPSNASSPAFANVANYQQQYKKLWGVG